MAKFITRTIASSKIVLGELNLESQEFAVIGSITEEGKVDKEKAIKIARKAFPDRQVIVTEIVYDEAQYKISVEDFIAHAEKVEAPAEEVQEEAELEVPTV